MKKEVIFVAGSSSWWKSIKYRKETASKLKKIKKNWRLKKIEILETKNELIDTKIYKKYYFYK